MSARTLAFLLSISGLLLGPASIALAAETPESAEATQAPPAADAAEAPRSRSQIEAQYHIMAGELAAGRGEPAVAAREFLQALELEPDAELAERAMRLAVSARDVRLALEAAQRWLALDPSSMDAREVIASVALRTGNLDETYKQALAIIKGHAGGPAEGFRHVALLLATEPGSGEAVQSLLAKLVAEYPKLAGAHYAMALAALRYNNLVQAERSAQEALKIEPGSADYGLLMVGVLARKGELAEADERMAKLLKKSKERDELRMAYVKLLLEAGQRDHARSQLQAALKANPKHSDARYALGILTFNDGDLEAARALFEPLTADPDRGDAANFQLGRVAEGQKRYEDALKLYASVNSGSQMLDAAVRKASVLARLGRVAEGRGVLQQLADQFPPLASRMVLAEGEMLVEVGAYADALNVYEKALASDPGNGDYLYGRSLAHEKSRRFDLAEADLRAILAAEPDDERAMNALGYLLTVHTDRYAEAKQLIGRAFQMSPDDPAIIDSMGWVQFKMGDAEGARGLLEKAYEKLQDPEIAAHYGEVLWTLGDKDRAGAVWNKALAADPEHEALKETVQRLRP